MRVLGAARGTPSHSRLQLAARTDATLPAVLIRDAIALPLHDVGRMVPGVAVVPALCQERLTRARLHANVGNY